MSTDGDIKGDAGIRLRCGGVVLLNPGSVTSFVPNPDHSRRQAVFDPDQSCAYRCRKHESPGGAQEAHPS